MILRPERALFHPVGCEPAIKNRLLPIFLRAGLGVAGVADAKSSTAAYGIVDGGYGFEQYRHHQQHERARATHSPASRVLPRGSFSRVPATDR